MQVHALLSGSTTTPLPLALYKLGTMARDHQLVCLGNGDLVDVWIIRSSRARLNVRVSGIESKVPVKVSLRNVSKDQHQLRR